MLSNDSLNDEPAYERVESFGGGVDAYKRSTLLDPDQSQLLENILVRDNYEARTRPGIEGIGPLTHPTNLFVSVTGSTSLALTWTYGLSDNIAIYRSLSPDEGFSLIHTTGANPGSYTDSTCSPDTLYYYKVAAVTAQGNSPFSNIASATTFPALPSPVTDLIVTPVSVSALALAWVNPIGGVVDQIKVYRATSLAGVYTLIATLSNGVQSYNDTGLSDGQYFYKIATVNITGSTDSPVSFATTYPIAPSGLVATPSFTSVALAWTNNSPTQVDVIISRSSALAGPYVEIDSIPGSLSAFTDSSVNQGETWYYKIRVANSAGESSSAGPSSATTLTISAPSPVLASTVSSSAISLAWVNTTANALQIVVMRATASGGPYSDIATISPSATSYNDTGLSELTGYYYKLRAENGAFTATSSEATSTTWSADVTLSTVLVSPTVNYFKSAGSIDSGTYKIVLRQGAFQGINTGLTRWNANQGGPDGIFVYFNGGSQKTPGNTTLYTSQANCEAVNNGALGTFTHAGGQVYLRYVDSVPGDNTNGSPNPTFYLVKL